MQIGTIRRCGPADFLSILGIINDAAAAYRGVIPEDCWHDPYMPETDLREEIAAGVDFWGSEREGELLGVMGMQPVGDVTLIRHAYVVDACRRRGVGTSLLGYLTNRVRTPLLIGTWAAATWAIRFYEKHGFTVVDPVLKDRLLKTYWTVPQRQIETSVVLADGHWFSQNRSFDPR